MSLKDDLLDLYTNGHRRLPPDVLEVMDRAAAELAASGLAERALTVGAPAPRFTLPSATGQEVSLEALLAEGPVVLTFYRGAWCPYCNLALRALQQHQGDFAARGARLVAVSPQIPDETLSLTEKEQLGFDVLSDIGSDVAEQYGVAFDLSDELGALYDRLGFDLDRVNDGHARTLPLPATYVIDRSGTVRWAFVDTDYTVRAEPSDILNALDALDALDAPA
ncbi:peroxiredoxin-like family protein [Streptomyces sp. NPDC029674]|uniref:peroxiredoxin-like family protein n=1 Tax=Streptomyces sp. NPDC029674 TaxID=3365297 RepID=UPI00384AE0E7